MLAQGPLEEDPALDRIVEELGQAELGVVDRDVVADAPPPVAGSWRHAAAPAAVHTDAADTADAASGPKTSGFTPR